MRSSVQRSRRAARSAELHCLLCHGVTLSEAESFPLYYSAVFQRAPMRNKINRNTSNELFADKKFFISYAPRFFFFNRGSRKPAVPQHTAPCSVTQHRAFPPVMSRLGAGRPRGLRRPGGERGAAAKFSRARSPPSTAAPSSRSPHAARGRPGARRAHT